MAPALRADVTAAPGEVRYAMDERDRDFLDGSRQSTGPGYRGEPRDAGIHLHQRLGPGPERQDSASVPAAPFENPYLNRMLAAVTAGDEASASCFAQEFAQSPQGVAFVHRGEQLLARQQAGEREVQQQPADQRQTGELERG